MFENVLKWLLTSLTSAAFLGFLAFFLRSTITKFMTKSVEHSFEKKIEKFKADIRDNEKEIEQIRSSIGAARRERDSALQAKRFEAAEILMRFRQSLSECSMLVEYLKILNIDEVVKNKGNPNMGRLLDTLVAPFKIDEKLKEFHDFDRIMPDLYLSDGVRDSFEVYYLIILSAALKIKMLSISLDNGNVDVFKKDTLKEKIISMIPSAEEGFNKHGDNYAYYWSDYFYKEILKNIKNELLGGTRTNGDTEAATRLALDARQAHLNLCSLLKETGSPEELMREIEI